ncbi:ABC transporter permease [Mangrovicoccus ximenensis]|uniref:ABC transporter permease n=1 Tax=Mangrovicoccus ximenensis TaxID=1911570 RepID=UPI0013752694|nr:ABC transporter permease subunit [Mangrovicoccus ximenensis]
MPGAGGKRRQPAQSAIRGQAQGLVDTLAGLVIGHTIFALPYVIVTVQALLRSYDHRLDLAAATLGAGRLATFRMVTFPVLRSGMLAAMLFAFVQSFDELSVSLFISGGARPTISKQLWTESLYKIDPALAAAATVMLSIVVLLVILAGVLQIRSRQRA